jgi:ABC-type molybdenum transport system ATPase subunit/photorepair protein PhrA
MSDGFLLVRKKNTIDYLCAMNENLIVRLSGAQIYQKDQQVLSDVDLQVAKGEFVYLIGKTGSGKSSLLKTLLWSFAAGGRQRGGCRF